MIVETARAFAGRGHDVTVYTSGSTATDEIRDGYRLVRWRQRHPAGVRHQRWFGRRVFVALTRHRFDVVHSLMPHDAAAAVWAARLRPLRTVYEDLGNPYRDKIDGSADRRARRRVIAGVDVYACMSDFSRRMLERDYGRPGTVVPGGVRFERHAPGPRAERPTILFSGAVDRPEKNVALLLEAVSILSRRRPEVLLQLSGPGDAAGVLATAPSAAVERTEVLPLGDPDDQGGRYAAAWVTCLPTQWDSFGLVVVESMAAGTPVVVGDVSAPAELVTPATGRRTDPLDAPTLAARLDEVLDMATDPATSQACRALAERFDWAEAIAPLLERLYTSGERL